MRFVSKNHSFSETVLEVGIVKNETNVSAQYDNPVSHGHNLTREVVSNVCMSRGWALDEVLSLASLLKYEF